MSCRKRVLCVVHVDDEAAPSGEGPNCCRGFSLIEGGTPLFSVSVASKGLRSCVSRLDATLTGALQMLQIKDLEIVSTSERLNVPQTHPGCKHPI